MSVGARIYSKLRGDKVIWMIVAMLAMFSILAVYSATGKLAYQIQGGNTEAYLVKHGIILAFGLLLCYLAYLLHYARYKNWAPWLLLLAIPLLVYTIAMGESIHEARRWIAIPGVGITFQTSDFAKLALILFVAREITRHKDYIKEFDKAFMPIIVPILIICGLIAPADLSTSLLLFSTCLLIMFVGRIDWKFIVLTIFLGVVVFAFLIILGEFFPDFVRTGTWATRLSDFLNGTGDNYQVNHAKIAIANGEAFGVGPGNSIMRNYLPASYADYIYAIIAEEYGMFGALIVMGLYLLLLFRAVRLVTKSDKSFGGMVALGICLLITLQALANMAVSVNLVPVTGLTLPMISMGGTSVLFTCISFGIVLSVSKFVESGEDRTEILEDIQEKQNQNQAAGGSDNRKRKRRGGGKKGGDNPPTGGGK